MVEWRRVSHEPSLSQVLVRPYGAGFAAGNSAALPVCFMNRRMPNGTSGGVGGRQGGPCLLPDLLAREPTIGRGTQALNPGGAGGKAPPAGPAPPLPPAQRRPPLPNRVPKKETPRGGGTKENMGGGGGGPPPPPGCASRQLPAEARAPSHN